MKPTILKVFSNYPDRSYDIKKNDENHLIRISNVENQNIPQIKRELLNSAFLENSYSNMDNISESNRDISVLEDYYRFQERRNAFMDSKKTLTQSHQSQHKRVYERPNFSYTQLIYMAIESSSLNALTVNDIYKWCELNFPYYANAIHGWKNSLRHNLSINKCFKKITKMGQGGRGSLWIVDPREKQHLVSTMHRSNVTSFSTPSFIIQTAPQHVEQPRMTITEDQMLEIPHEDSLVFSEDSFNSQMPPVSITFIEEKPSYSWTDTRLPCDYTVELTPDDCSHASDTDYNDWKRAMISPEPIFPVKRHQFSPKGPMYPIVTPPNSVDHNYSIPNFQTVLDDPSYVCRHMFQPSVNSNLSYCTSSDYNDEEWPRTPSPVLVTTRQPQIKQEIIKTESKRGRPRNSTKQKKIDMMMKPKSKITQHERINNMYNLNNFINSL